MTAEVNALIHYNGRGAVRLIKADPAAGWLLMERCTPGLRLLDIPEETETMAIAVYVMHQLWRPVENHEQFPSLGRWLRGLERMNNCPFLINILPKITQDFVRDRAQELLLSQGEPVLLHADLHHYNILQHQSTWVAIDPKGVVGERV